MNEKPKAVSPAEALVRQAEEKSFLLRLGEALPQGSGLVASKYPALFKLALVNKPELQGCTSASLLTALLKAAALGLDPSGVTKEFSLIKRGNEACGEPEYRGFLKIAKRTGLFKHIFVKLVHVKDEFELCYHDPDQPFIHRPFIPRDGATDAGEVIGGYGVAWLKDGTVAIRYMTTAEIDRHREFAATKKVWDAHRDAMREKTLVRQLCDKDLAGIPGAEDLVAAAIEDGAQQAGEAPPVDASLPATPKPPKSKAVADALKAKATPDAVEGEVLDDGPPISDANGLDLTPDERGD